MLYGRSMKKILFVLIPMICLGQVNSVRISDKGLDPIFAKKDLIAISNQKAEPYNGVNWENEIIDSVDLDIKHYRFNSMALDTNGIPCVVYNPGGFNTIMFAWSTDSGWQKEVVESGLKRYGFSLIIDDSNTTHLSYYRRNDSLDMTVLFQQMWHTFASRLVMAGVDIRAVQELMGHKSIKMAMKYSH